MRFGVLNEDVQADVVLLHDAEEVDVLPAGLRRRARLVVVLLLDLALVARRLQQRDVHVEVVRHLDRADELRELVLEVLAAGRGHHEVVLHRDGEALAHDVAGERLLALREHARGGLVRHARRDALVERVHVPLELLVRLLEVHVRQDVAREGRARRVGDEPVDAVGEVLVVPLERVGEVPALVALVALRVLLDVPPRRPEDVLVHVDRRLGARAGERAAAGAPGVARLEVHRMREFAVCMSLSNVKAGRHFAWYGHNLNMDIAQKHLVNATTRTQKPADVNGRVCRGEKRQHTRSLATKRRVGARHAGPEAEPRAAPHSDHARRASRYADGEPAHPGALADGVVPCVVGKATDPRIVPGCSRAGA